jgi:ubiquinone/menaquinone biosynthesis C-methylase UbiE
MSDLPGLLSLYSQTAPFYEQQVVPIFALLARDLATWILQCAAHHLDYSLYDPFDLDEQISPESQRQLTRLHAVDIGTGTGILARQLAPSIGSIIGLDLSPAMLTTASRYIAGKVRLLQADVHHLPLRPGSIQLAVSSFGLNASTPKKSLRALARLLHRGGMLAFQEWSVEDDCSRIVDETLRDHEPAETPDLDDALSAFYAAPKPWYDQLQDTADYYEMFKQVGFDLVWVKDDIFVTVHLPTLEPFIRYKMAWPGRRLALEAMTPAERRDFESDLQLRLQPYLNSDGSFDWTPRLFRVLATV